MRSPEEGPGCPTSKCGVWNEVVTGSEFHADSVTLSEYSLFFSIFLLETYNNIYREFFQELQIM